MEKLRGIIFPEPDEITLVVIKLGEGPLGQVVSHAPITVNASWRRCCTTSARSASKTACSTRAGS